MVTNALGAAALIASCSRSNACCDFVPGIENVSRAETAKPMPPSAMIHRRTTRPRRRKQKSRIPERNVATEKTSLSERVHTPSLRVPRPLLRNVRVEGWWPAAFGSFGSPVCVLVGLALDRRGDAPSAQILAVGRRRVRLVGQHPVRWVLAVTRRGTRIAARIEQSRRLSVRPWPPEVRFTRANTSTYACGPTRVISPVTGSGLMTARSWTWGRSNSRPGGRWNDEVSAYVNNQTHGANTYLYNWNGVNRWDCSSAVLRSTGTATLASTCPPTTTRSTGRTSATRDRATGWTRRSCRVHPVQAMPALRVRRPRVGGIPRRPRGQAGRAIGGLSPSSPQPRSGRSLCCAYPPKWILCNL